jgi:hypothetical protein
VMRMRRTQDADCGIARHAQDIDQAGKQASLSRRRKQPSQRARKPTHDERKRRTHNDDAVLFGDHVLPQSRERLLGVVILQTMKEAA